MALYYLSIKIISSKLIWLKPYLLFFIIPDLKAGGQNSILYWL